MTEKLIFEKKRQRAPSQRAIQTRNRILDAAERVFAAQGFDGATIRDIAAEARTPVGLVHHHGGGKVDLFAKTVDRRAVELSQLRLGALATRKSKGPLTLTELLRCFYDPFLDLTEKSGEQWMCYARLVAHVSADARWRELAAHCFDPTAQKFIDEIALLYPNAPRPAIAAGFVYSVSAMLALLTSVWRMGALGDGDAQTENRDGLIAFCSAGMAACLAEATVPETGPSSRGRET